MEGVAKHVVDDIGHADLHLRPVDDDGLDEEPHFVPLPGEHTLEGGPEL
tara:strand:- start:1125 stop:1271 length:147 start_codon:yes stop_codon:yes gene_type:complete